MDSTETGARSVMVRFFDRFLQDRNIKWILGVGTAIVLGSSAMLVAQHWGDATTTWKQGVMLGYTALIFVVGLWAYHRVGLRRTGTVLLGLTVCLLPLLMMALHWVAGPAGVATAVIADSAEPISIMMRTGLLVVTGIFASVAATIVFRLLLRGAPVTFLLAYGVLSLAGALSSPLPPPVKPFVLLGLWSVLVAGTVKVDRHLFWLEERGQRPRVFGLFPVLLLGAQFAALWAVSFGQDIPRDWMGLGAVLMALPVLIAADARARIHELRSGVLSRPLPLDISAPLVFAILLGVTGVVLSLAGLAPGGTLKAVTPTNAIAVVLAALIARRTKKQVFVWAAMACAVLAYNFSAVFFAQFAQQVATVSATAVAEEALPYAFYGVTYIPLIAALTALGVWASRRGNDVFATPLRDGCIGLCFVLLALASSHVKAWWPVGGTLAAVFVVQGVVFRRRALVFPALAAWGLAAVGMIPFLRISGAAPPLEVPLLTTLGLAAACLAVGKLAKVSDEASGPTNPWWLASVTGAVLVSAVQLWALLTPDGDLVIASNPWLASVGPKSLRARSTNMMCSAFSFGSARSSASSARSVSSSAPRGRVPAMGRRDASRP